MRFQKYFFTLQVLFFEQKWHGRPTSSHWRPSVKRLFLHISQISQNNTRVGVSFQTWMPATSLKKFSNTCVFPWNLGSYKEHLFWGTSVDYYFWRERKRERESLWGWIFFPCCRSKHLKWTIQNYLEKASFYKSCQTLEILPCEIGLKHSILDYFSKVSEILEIWADAKCIFPLNMFWQIIPTHTSFF